MLGRVGEREVRQNRCLGGNDTNGWLRQADLRGYDWHEGKLVFTPDSEAVKADFSDDADLQ